MRSVSGEPVLPKWPKVREYCTPSPQATHRESCQHNTKISPSEAPRVATMYVSNRDDQIEKFARRQSLYAWKKTFQGFIQMASRKGLYCCLEVITEHGGLLKPPVQGFVRRKQQPLSTYETNLIVREFRSLNGLEEESLETFASTDTVMAH